ncbi:MAG TPA: hypothetical protein VI456_02280 [Polyangia bacterium]
MRVRRLAWGAAGLAALLFVAAGAAPAAAETPASPPAEPQMIHLPRDGLVIAGRVTFLVSYGLAFGSYLTWSKASASCASCSEDRALVLVPLAGPILAATSESPSERALGSLWPYVVWSAVQATGTVMTIVGLVGHEVPQQPIPGTTVQVTLVPTVTPERRALSLVLRW